MHFDFYCYVLALQPCESVLPPLQLQCSSSASLLLFSLHQVAWMQAHANVHSTDSEAEAVEHEQPSRHGIAPTYTEPQTQTRSSTTWEQEHAVRCLLFQAKNNQVPCAQVKTRCFSKQIRVIKRL